MKPLGMLIATDTGVTLPGASPERRDALDRVVHQAQARLQKQMNDPDHRTRVCIHEAAHEAYFYRAGAKEVHRFGPRIVFPSKSEDRRPFVAGAGVQAISYHQDVPVLAQFLKAAAAGGVAVRVLLGSKQAMDKEDFHGAFETFQMLTGIRFSPADLRVFRRGWNLVKAAVREDLNDVGLRREILRIAQDFEKEVFGNAVAKFPVA
jgi:hypothetical protein